MINRNNEINIHAHVNMIIRHALYDSSGYR